MQKSKLFLWKEKWNLTQYDVKDSGGSEVIRWYRVRKTWQTASRRKEPIRFWIMRRSVLIRIRDNGVGCDDIKDGFGLTHMRERVEMLHGTVKCSSYLGFQIIVRLPIRWRNEK